MDPLCKRGIRLLLSKAPDSLVQLKALVEEAHMAKQRSSIMSSKLNIDDSSSSVPLAKRPRLAESNPVSAPHTPSPTPSLKSDGSSSRNGGRRSDESDQETDFNDLALEITDGISCTVCKRITFYSANQLVECQECHLVYHQDCHKPSINQADITDPRRVWYCAKCTRNMRKQSVGGGSVSSSTRSSSSSKISSSSSRPSQSSSSKSSSHVSPVTASPSKTSRPSPFANLSAVSTRGSDRGSSTAIRSESSKSGTSQRTEKAPVPPTSAPNNSMLSAERRMHMMKKKAAAKMALKKL